MTDQLPPFTPSREMPSYNPATAPPLPAYPPPAYRSGPLGYYAGPPSTTMATWALVLAIVPIVLGNLVAIVLAVRVLLRSKDGRNHGNGRAIAALVIAPLWLLLNVALITQAFSGQADRNVDGAVTGRGDIQVDALELGDCFPEVSPEGSQMRTVEVVPCSEAHVGEVFADFKLDKGPFPGIPRVLRLAQGGCAKRVDQYVGQDRDLSTMRLTYYYPLAQTWDRDRSIKCIVVTASPAAGSVRGTQG
jgi:hypothetical protein